MAWKILPGGGAARSGNGLLRGHRDRVDPSHWQTSVIFQFFSMSGVLGASLREACS